MKGNSILHRFTEEIKKDREKLKGKTFLQKLEYYVMYYKIPAIITVAVIAILVSVCYTRSQSKSYGFHADFINASNTISDESFNREFGEIIEIDNDHSIVSIDSSFYIEGTSQQSISSTEKLAGEINSEILDVCIMPQSLFLTYAEEGCYGDLREYLTEEQTETYSDLFVYQNDIPVGIRAENFSKLQDADLYPEEEAPVFGILYNAPHPTECSEFVDYLNS